jgi:hypothetical protein
MNITLKDFMANRKAEIKQQIAALKAELRDIQAAEGALTPGGGGESAAESSVRTRGRITIKDMIVSVLTPKPQGAEAQEIIESIKAQYGKEIARPSLSPQLSRLKEDGTLILDNKIWQLAKTPVPKSEAPNATASDAPKEFEQEIDLEEEIPF